MNFAMKVRNVYKYDENGIVKYFTYIGDSDNSNEILGGEVSLPVNNRPYQNLKDINMVLYTDKLLIIHPTSIIGGLYISGNPVEIPAYEFQNLINSLCMLLLNSYSTAMIAVSNNNFNSSNYLMNDLSFPEKLLRLLLWNLKKKELKFDRKQFIKRVYKYNIYFAYMGCNVGCEIDKLRPVLIWKEHANVNNLAENSYYIFPISSKIPKKKYYYNVEIDINGTKSIIKINDGKRISTRRIIKPCIDNVTKKTLKISEEKINDVIKAISMYFSVNRSIK